MRAARTCVLVSCAVLPDWGTQEEKGDVGDRLEAGSVEATDGEKLEFEWDVPGS